MNCFENCSLISFIEIVKSENDIGKRRSLLNELHDNYLNNDFDGVSQNDERNVVECFIWECNNNGDYYNVSSILKDTLNRYISKHGFDNLVKSLEDRNLMIDVAVCLQLGCQYTDVISLYKRLIYNANITEEELKYAVKMMYLLVDEPESMKVLSEKEHKLFQKYCKTDIMQKEAIPMKRVFLIVLDSVGIGALPDAQLFGDEGTNTLKSCYNTGHLEIPNLIKLGLSNIEGCSYLGEYKNPVGSYGRCMEMSKGKDTTTGHWEIAGLTLGNPFPTYPDGFPKEILDEFEKQTGQKVLCNKPYSGTDVIRDYGKEHLESGALIVYTSSDSVFQIAAHEDVVPVETLYEYCRIARKILVGDHAAGRVIARPFVGEIGAFTRTNNRRDFSVEPTGTTVLDLLKNDGFDVISVGKINDIFAAVGITKDTDSHGNAECMEMTLRMLDTDFNGLCFINLVDFDSSYGHRNNAVGYAEELGRFDKHLGEILPKLRDDDLLIITADHGCDPGDVSTDHTREYTPLLVYGKNIKPESLGTRGTFSDIAASVAEYLGTEYNLCGKSFLGDIL